MTKKDEERPKTSLAQQDALKRLDKVEEEKRKPYKKKKEPKSFRAVLMTLLLILVLGLMIGSYFMH
ncbi:hypothetical protein H5S40_08575 [Limosilactobacillus sp. RRLNB_1_1]|mgnify:CR=1 FL=1|uniref:Uncharacterized protein n=2 Tax=Limosilactobacillus TaxID=2742598 RepID=A0A7W3TSV1_9LACO|nr:MULTISPECIES: hypothetical protein [Limosilactobacillus]MBC8744614.1 hypothetical protein [Lactobacillus sp. Marseille-P7033]MRH46941.1 hypothetical protein [Limosilactobacillus reuteri]MBB1070204.1 hypothetical protein [Limosilactobacillus albertensis]MCD7119199.1 hypothetical protein [Limosilactobacillus albertensis]MCD7123560.1 hypothetical protein [Limosilactobacillus caviae]